MLYKDPDFKREYQTPSPSSFTTEEYRNSFRRDYARLLHSAAFRRLGGKTQLFPGTESDFFRNRMTHSLEVAQIAKSIAIRINNTEDFFQPPDFQINPDLVETAGLAHDLGHPPFGHNGEHALDDCMRSHGGFEGNAQTLRILSRLEKKAPVNEAPYGVGLDGTDKRYGLNLTYRTLAAVLKYDNEIPLTRTGSHLTKGYYHSEGTLVKKIQENVASTNEIEHPFKTIECQIMDVADDIAYSTYDLEDALKAGFLTPLDMISADSGLLQRISNKVAESIDDEFEPKDVIKVLLDIFISQGIFDLQSLGIEESQITNDPHNIAFIVATAYQSSHKLASVGYLRTRLTSELVGEFVRGIQVEVNETIPALSKVTLENNVLKKVETLKHFTFESLIMSPRLKVVEHRGYDIVKTIFTALTSDSRSDGGYLLLPDDFRGIYDRVKSENEKKRTVCDFIAGMTDRYAVEFYSRLTSVGAQTIFKPL